MGPQKKMTEAERKEKERLRKAAARAISGVDRVVSASQDQGSLIYGEDAGSQCTCMALMAAVYAYDKSPTEWTTRDLDSLMDSGNTLYSCTRGSRSFLLINELPKQVYHDKAQFTVNFPQNGENYCGTINCQTTKQPFYSLKDALTCAGNVSKCHFVVMGAPKCAYASMVIDMGDEGYFIFDSHSRDELGLFASNGKGVLVKLKTLNAAVAYIKQLTSSMALTSNTFFEVVPCVIAKKEADTEVFFTSMTEFFSKTELMRKKKRESQAEWLKNEGVKKQRKDRESIQRAEPKVKKQRKERESKQRAEPGVKEKRKIQREQQGSNLTVKKQRKERESSQRAEPEVKKQRKERESSQRAEPEVKKQRKERESSQRAEPEVKKQRKERESSQRAEPEVKKQRKERESSQRAEPEVKKQRKDRESSQRAEPEVKKQRKERESSQRAEPEVKKQRKERESSQRAEPEVKKQRKERESSQRAEPEVKKQRKERESSQRAEPEVKKQRKERESSQRVEPEVKNQRQERESSQRAEPEVKKQRKERESSQRAEPVVKKQRQERESSQRSDPNVKRARQAREAEQRADPVIKQQRCQKRKDVTEKREENIEFIAQRFKANCSEIPEYICCVCNRIRFRAQVQKYLEKKYDQKLHHLNIRKDDKSLWVCTSCHRHLLKNKVPPMSVVAHDLNPTELPEGLQDLNTLEQFLITPIIPFMKLIPLPKGSQRGMYGPVVCVASNVEEVAKTLPRNFEDDAILKVKLKRKLQYRGHHLYQTVRVPKVLETLRHLKVVHQSFKDIQIMETIDEVLEGLEEQLVAEESEGTSTNPNTQGDQDIIVDGPEGSGDEEIREESDSDNIDKSQDPDDVAETSVPLVTCLQPDDPAQFIGDHYEDDILCIAPAEGRRPQSIQGKEADAFPTLFPDGLHTYKDNSDHISMSNYVKSRFLSADFRFAQNSEYIFYMQYLKEFNEVLSSAKISLRKGGQSGAHSDVTVGQLTSGADLRKLIHKNEGYKFLNKVRGSAPYWESTMRELCAMVRQLGVPTWFTSFSAADSRWSEISKAILTAQGKTVPDSMDWTEHCKVISSNPVIASIMFDKRAKHLITDVIKSKAAPIGEVVDFFYRIEFQQRGWPHIHGLFWVKDAPKLQSDGSTDSDVTSFVDRHVTCDLPSTNSELCDIVSSVQMHSKNHTRSCRKGNRTCRFNFPRPPSKRTFICRPISCPEDIPEKQWLKEAEQVVEKVWQTIKTTNNPEITTDDVLVELGLSQEEYEAFLGRLAKKVTIILRREPWQCWVNQYNEHLLSMWNANIDVQYVVDAYSCISYILSYVSKKESEEGQLLKNAQKEAREGNDDAVKELRKLGTVYLTHREISIMEAIWRGIGLNLKSCSRETKWVPADDEGVRMSLPLTVLRNIEKQRGSDATDIWQTSVIERYWCRPKTKIFEDMCLATFVSNYRIITSFSKADDSDQSDDDNDQSKTVKLLDGKGAIKKRKKECIIRYARTPRHKNSEKHFKTLMKMYLPHRGKEILPKNFDSCEAYFFAGKFKVQKTERAVKDIVNENMMLYEHNSEAIDDAWADVMEHGAYQEPWVQPLENTEEDQARQQQRQEEEDDVALPDLDNALAAGDKRPNRSNISEIETCHVAVPRQEAISIMRSMNEEQRHIFTHLRKWCMEKMIQRQLDPFHIFLTGGAGTGKSHVVKGFWNEAAHIFAPSCESPDDITVLVVAYTGTAAFNIGGQTIHSALSIQTSRRNEPYKPLGEDAVTRLRQKYRSLQVMIIDEVSMVGTRMMNFISERLKQIKRSKVVFGGVSVLAVGDFYQIPPVADRPLYNKDPGDLVQSPWDFFKAKSLVKIMRQKEDLLFADLLNEVRTKKKNENLRPESKALLQSRCCDINAAPKKSLHVFARNAEADKYNTDMLEDCGHEVHRLQACDTVNHKAGTVTIRDKPASTKQNVVLKAEVLLAESARVMVITNLDVSDGLSNGVMGTIKKIDNSRMHMGLPIAMYVLFDNPRVGMTQRKQHPPPRDVDPRCTRIVPHNENFDSSGLKITRFQYPLKLAWGCTIHKTQGMSVDEVVVSLRHIFLAGMAYVAMSRSRTLAGLFITDCDWETLYCDPKVTGFLEKMPQLHIDCMPLLHQTIPEIKPLTVICHNVRSLVNHFEDIRNNPEMTEADIICICETWLTSQHSSKKFKIPGYTLWRCDRRTDSGRGGVAVYCKDALSHNAAVSTPRCVELGLEMLLLKTEHNVTVCIVYRSSILDKKKLDTAIRTVISTAEKGSPILFIGDFNENILADSNANILPSLDTYEQIISEATYYGPSSEISLLDHIYKRHCNVLKSGVLDTYYSDHNPIYVQLTQRPNQKL